MRFLPVAWLFFTSASTRVPAANLPVVLTNAVQVRALSPAEAARKLPVRLCGVVTDMDQKHSNFSMVDETAGIYVEMRGIVADFGRGDLIEVKGVSNPGKFAPFLEAQTIQKLGAGKIPEPRPADVDELLNGKLDAQWISVSGVVRRVKTWPFALDLEVELAGGSGRILAHQNNPKTGVAVDSTVRLHGVCYYQFNKTGQAIRPYLAIPASEPIMVEKPAVTNLADIPLRSIGSLMQFDVGDAYLHRVHVRGIVIYSRPGAGFWIHDSGRGVQVVSEDENLIPAGAEADVFGFMKRGDYSPIIEDAVFRKTNRMVPAVPVVRLNRADKALDHDADLVQCEATIVEQWNSLDGCRLTLTDGGTEFPAILHLANRNVPPPRWLIGTKVRVTGVCTVGFYTTPVGAGTISPQYFQLLLRSPADIQVLQLPPWWNAEHVAWVTGGVAVLLLLSMAVIVWIGQRRLRGEALERAKSEAEFAAVWNERNRLARELHDTLAQGLGAISLHLETAKRRLPANADAQSPVEEARLQTRASLSEVRNAIWNMRSQVLETGDLASALQGVLHSLADASPLKAELLVKGNARRFAPVVENNLLRIGQEAITNAVKHAQAKNMEVVLQFDERQFELSVSDDGRGFDPAHPPTSEGGLGLTSMRERAAELNGTLTVDSVPGKGTVIRLLLPLSKS